MNELALPTIPGRGEYTADAQAQRLQWLRAQCGAPLVSLDGGHLDARRLPGNIENFVASVELPVGLAGPLLFTGDHARGLITAPMATTEGALVASASRGARAITLSGGVTTRALSQRMTRAPAYEFTDICAAAKFIAWLAPDAGSDEVAHYLEAHRHAIDPGLDRAEWRKGYGLALQKFLLTRLQMYLLAHTHYEYTFLPGVVQTAWRLWELES